MEQVLPIIRVEKQGRCIQMQREPLAAEARAPCTVLGRRLLNATSTHEQ